MQQSNTERFQYVLLICGAVLALLAVALGAFGAHGLQSMVSTDALRTFETGVRYHMYHALGLLAIGTFAGTTIKSAYLKWTGLLHVGGILLFSGSLYLYVFTQIHVLVFLTPIGGVLFVAGWATLAIGLIKEYRQRAFQ